MFFLCFYLVFHYKYLIILNQDTLRYGLFLSERCSKLIYAYKKLTLRENKCIFLNPLADVYSFLFSIKYLNLEIFLIYLRNKITLDK